MLSLLLLCVGGLISILMRGALDRDLNSFFGEGIVGVLLLGVGLLIVLIHGVVDNVQGILLLF